MAGKHRAPRKQRKQGPSPLSSSLPSALRDAGEQLRAAPRALRTPPKWSAIPLSWRTTGGVMVGAAVLGTAAATAQASVLPFDSGPSGSAENMAVVVDADRAAAGASGAGEGGKPQKGGSAEGSDGGSGKEGSGDGAGNAKSKPTAQDAIKLAKAQVGIEEDSSGETKFNDWYVESDRSKKTVERDGGSLTGYSNAAWCDMFVSWIGDQLGFTEQFGHDAWTVAHAEWFQEEDRWGTEPEPGAIVFFDWGGGSSTSAIDHVGMVIEENDDGTVKTVEGNTDNAVKIRERSTSEIAGYGYIDYAK